MSTRQFFWNSSFLGWQSFWGIFDAFSRPMPDPAYYPIIFMQVLAVMGGLAFLVRGGFNDKAQRRAAFVLAFFAALVIVIFYMVNWRIYSPQGRYLFPLMTPFGIGTAVGWTAIWKPRLRFIPVIAALAILLLLNLLAVVIMPVRPLVH